MAKKMRKILALVLATSMCVGLLNITAMAMEPSTTTENNPDGTTTTVTVTFGEGGNATSTTTTTTGSETTPSSSVDADGNKHSTTQTTTNTSETVETPTTPGGDASVNGTITNTTSESNQSKTEVTDPNGNPVKAYGTNSGSSTTESRKTTTESETTTDVIINGNGNGETNVGPEIEIGRTDGQPVETNVNPDNNGWVEGTPTDTGTWTKDENKSEDGQFTQQGGTNKPTETSDVTVDQPGVQVELNLTPMGTDTETIYIGIDDTNFDQSQIPQAVTDEAYTDKDTGKTGTKTVKVEEIKENGKVVGYNVTTTITYNKEQTSQSTGNLEETGTETVPVSTQTAPQIPAEWNELKDSVQKDADGNVTEEVTVVQEPITNDKGEVIGYKLIKTTTTYDRTHSSNESTDETTTASGEPVETFTLPAKPAESQNTDAQGNTTTVTVEDIYENGKHVGYKSVTVKVDANGKEVSRASNSVFGTTTTMNSTTVTDPTKETTDTTTKTQTVETTTIYGTIYTKQVELEQERTTTYETEKTVDYQVIEMDGQLFFFYKGEMGEVSDTGSTGTTKLDSIKANQTQYSGTQHTSVDDDIQTVNANPHGSWRLDPSADTPEKREALREQLEPGEYVLIGRGLVSEYNIDHDNGWAHVPTQYAIMDHNGNIQYGYCVELGVGLKFGDTSSGIYDESELLNYKTFYDSEEKVAQLAIVAHNGFWGTYETENGVEKDVTGSLAAVKNLLKDNQTVLGLSDTELNNVLSTLTAGQAMTATQAAIWKYGNHGDMELNSIQNLMQYYKDTGANDTDKGYYDSSTQDYKNIDALFQVLTYMADKGLGAPPETITKDDLTNATIILDGKATNDNGSVKTVDVDGKTYEKYNTDIAFTLAVAPSSVEGQLIVQVIANGGEVVATRRLAGDDSATNYGMISPDANGTYTIPNLEIAEGVNITLKLDGTQHLADGVYVYECANSQNFIGLSSVDHDVNLSVNMSFTVEDPTAQVRESGKTENWLDTDTVVERRNESRTDTRETSTSETDSVTTQQTTTVTKVYADVTVTEVTEESTKSAQEWSENWEESYPNIPVGGDDDADDDDSDDNTDSDGDFEIPDDEVPLAELPLTEMPDEEIPLAELPMTGDISALWYAVTLLSGGGLMGLKLAAKKRDEE